MAFRTFALFAIQSTNVPQPLAGSWIASGIGAPAQGPTVVTLGTMTTSGNDATNIFKVGDPARLIDPGGANDETVLITAVSGNTVTIGNLQGNPATVKTHVSGAFNTGTFILPARLANNCFVAREDAGSGTWIYIGNDPNMTANFRRIVKLATVSAGTMPYNYGATESFGGNPFQMSELWVFGTATDGYNVSFAQV